jgi:L-rhamnose mutarotase
MPIYALTLDLKDDRRLISEYLEHHRRVWPEVLEALAGTGVEDIKIYLAGRRLFMVMTAAEGFDPEWSFAEYRKNPVAKRWDELMKTYQERLPEAEADQWWMPLTPVFDFTAQLKASRGGPEAG